MDISSPTPAAGMRSLTVSPSSAGAERGHSVGISAGGGPRPALLRIEGLRLTVVNARSLAGYQGHTAVQSAGDLCRLAASGNRIAAGGPAQCPAQSREQAARYLTIADVWPIMRQGQRGDGPTWTMHLCFPLVSGEETAAGGTAGYSFAEFEGRGQGAVQAAEDQIRA